MFFYEGAIYEAFTGYVRHQPSRNVSLLLKMLSDDPPEGFGKHKKASTAFDEKLYDISETRTMINTATETCHLSTELAENYDFS
jgi:hypothetical protein